MALLATQQIDLDGEVTDLVAAAGGGDTFEPGDNVFLEVLNGGGAPITVTIDSVRLSDLGTDVNPAVAVAAGARTKIGPFPASRFRNQSDGLVHATYSGVTSVTVGVFAL